MLEFGELAVASGGGNIAELAVPVVFCIRESASVLLACLQLDLSSQSKEPVVMFH
jgi:hypothetical protein